MNPSIPHIRALIRRAIQEKRVLHIEYVSQYRGYPDRTQRDIEPLEIHGPMVEAYCHLREDKRNFRFDRIEHLELTGERFSTRRQDPPASRRFNTRADSTSEPSAGQGCTITLLVLPTLLTGVLLLTL